MDPELRKEVNFNGYLEILGVKGGNPHSQWNPKGENKDLQNKINKMQIHPSDGKKMTARAWLHQLQTYFTLSANLIEEDAIYFASLHLEGDALEWWRHGSSIRGIPT